jgi:uncharacterized protein (TIGR02145 family)
MKVKTLTIIAFLCLFSVSILFSCKKEFVVSIPTLTTSIGKITQSTVICNCDIYDYENAKISEVGFCWNTKPNPTISDNKTKVSAESANSIDTISGLNSNKEYYIRSYAKNSKGITYGNEISFTLWINTPGPVIVDTDGNKYNSVKIGTQIWMSENLKVTHYTNGDDILNDFESTNGAYCWYNNDKNNNAEIYGALYNWYAIVDKRNICPAGWHIPSDDEWSILTDYLGGNNIAGGMMKEIGTEHWKIGGNIGATNESGFKALPGGHATKATYFYELNEAGYWWSATESSTNEAWCRYIFGKNDDIVRDMPWVKAKSFSIRCVKD